MIKSLEAKNYKSLADFRMDLSPFNVLVGPNNSGKSNIIDCLSFLSDITTVDLREAYRKRGDFNHLVFGGHSQDSFSIKVSMTSGNSTGEYTIEIDSSGVLAETLVTSEDGKEETLLRGRKGGGAFYDDLEKGMKQYQYGPEASALLNLRDLKRNQTIGRFRSDMMNWRFYSFAPFLMRRSDPARKGFDPGQRGDKVNIVTHSLISEYRESFEDLEETLKSAIKEIQKLRSPLTEDGHTYVAVKEKDFENPFDYYQMSDGTLSFLAYLLVILGPKSKSPSLVCFEEPENFIHPRLLQLLAQILKKAKGQVIITTHSPYLVDFVDVDDLVIVEKTQGKTICKKPPKQKLLKLLRDFSLGELWYSGKFGGVS